MNSQTNTDYLNAWWKQKLGKNYGVQLKHIAAAQLLTSKHFPLADLGAGSGVFLKLLEERFHDAELSGVEISDTAVENKICSSRIEKGNLEFWQPGGNISCISLVDVIEHMPDPELILDNFAKHCEYLLLTCPNFNFIKARWDVLIGRIPFQNRINRGGHIYWCQYELIKKALKRSGFTVIGENHLYPKNHHGLLRRILNLRPAIFAHEFVFIAKQLRNKR